MEKFKYLAKDKFSKLPRTPGVYAFKGGGKFLYIGKAVNLRSRVKNHQGEPVFSLAKHIAYIETDSEIEALLLESQLIKKYQPKYNVVWKDDKNYFYVGITEENYPRVFITHQPFDAAQGKPKLKTDYMGPFTDGKTLKKALAELRKRSPYRTCKTLPKKPCLWYHLNQCPAPCLPFPQVSQRVEAYDISNIQGQQATGSMVTFVNGKPDKNFYRKFKIKMENKPNDVAMIREVLQRRFNHPEWPYPDLILIDGGKAQFNAALCALPQSAQSCALCGSAHRRRGIYGIKIMALAKKNNELFIENKKKPVLLKNLPKDFANLILRVRDEAHRFALAYHHYLRDKSLLD